MAIFQFEKLKKFPNLTHGISTSSIGNLSYKWGENTQEVWANRQKFFSLLGVSEKRVVATQLVHGDKIYSLNDRDCGKGVENPESGLEGDGFFSNIPDVNIFIIVADCLALFFYDPKKNVCGLVHAGWRGVDAYLPRNAIKYMRDEFNCDLKDIIVCASPSLQVKSAKFKELEQSKLKHWQKYVYSDGEFNHANVSLFAYDQIIEAGVSKENIEWSNIDTLTSNEFFSHRRSVEEGIPEARFGCIIGLK